MTPRQRLCAALLSAVLPVIPAGAESSGPARAGVTTDLAAPTAGETFEAWCVRLRTVEPFVPYRCMHEDDLTEPGHPSRTRRIRWIGTDVARAFELARALFGVPASMAVPRSGPREQSIEDPRKPPEIWESTLTVRRASDGSLREARWHERREGSGRTVSARRVDVRFIEVSEVAFAD